MFPHYIIGPTQREEILREIKIKRFLNFIFEVCHNEVFFQTAGPTDFQNVLGISFLPANFTIDEDNFSSITENSLVVLDDFSFKLANNKQAKINFLKVVNYILVIHKLV